MVVLGVAVSSREIFEVFHVHFAPQDIDRPPPIVRGHFARVGRVVADGNMDSGLLNVGAQPANGGDMGEEQVWRGVAVDQFGVLRYAEYITVQSGLAAAAENFAFHSGAPG